MDDLDNTLTNMADALRSDTDARIDVDKALATVSSRQASATSAARTPKRLMPWRPLGIAAAAAVLVVGLAAVLDARSTDQPIPDQQTAPLPMSPPVDLIEPVATVAPSPSTTDAPSVPIEAATTAPATAPATSTPPAAPASDPCAGDTSIEQATVSFYDAMLIARTLDDLELVGSCLSAVPELFDREAPSCWASCERASRTFLGDTFEAFEVFDMNGNSRRMGSAAVSYVTDTGDRVEVVENWTISPTGDRFTVSDFTIEPVTYVTRAESAATIATYFDHLDNGDWQTAATMLDDGARNLDERSDLQRLDPAVFTTDAIAVALEQWCQLGCVTLPPSPNQLRFDGSYGFERNGQTVTAAWFEGIYSISGLPILHPEALAAEFDEAVILSDGVVTEAEYRSMYAFVSQCMTQAGSDGLAQLSDFDELDQRFDYVVTGEQVDAFDACYDEHGQDIDTAFQLEPTRDEIRTIGYEFVARCTQAAGIDVRQLVQTALDERPETLPPVSLDQIGLAGIVDMALNDARGSDLDVRTTIGACIDLGRQRV